MGVWPWGKSVCSTLDTPCDSQGGNNYIVTCSAAEECLYFPFHLILCLLSLALTLSLSVFISITVRLYLSFLERISGLPRGWYDEVKIPQTHTHPDSCAHPVRSCTWRDSIHIHTEPKGIGSNEDTGLEQGYHNKLCTACALSYMRLLHCLYQVKMALWSSKGTISWPAICSWEKDGKRQKKDEVSKIKRCISNAFISGFSGIFYILFTSKAIGRGPFCSHQLAGSFMKPKHQNSVFVFFSLDSWLNCYKAISCPRLEKRWSWFALKDM